MPNAGRDVSATIRVDFRVLDTIGQVVVMPTSVGKLGFREPLIRATRSI